MLLVHGSGTDPSGVGTDNPVMRAVKWPLWGWEPLDRLTAAKTGSLTTDWLLSDPRSR